MYQLLAGGTQSHLTVVTFNNALFHPKVVHVVDPSGEHAVVGSPNMTEQALGLHVEALIEIDAETASEYGVLVEIAAAIDRWNTVDTPGVYQITASSDVDQLLAQGILINEAERRGRRARSAGAGSTSSGGRGSRGARWHAPQQIGQPTVESEADVSNAEIQSAGPAGPAGPASITYRWSKRLTRSDVNKNQQNERNLLSLGVGRGREGRVINSVDDIREIMMADASWSPVRIGGREAESATLSFAVTIPGRPTQLHTLEVIHAPHRGSGQNNYHTSIRWDAGLAQIFRSQAGEVFTGSWITIDKSDSGQYSLDIVPGEPNPRSIGLLS